MARKKQKLSSNGEDTTVVQDVKLEVVTLEKLEQAVEAAWATFRESAWRFAVAVTAVHDSRLYEYADEPNGFYRYMEERWEIKKAQAANYVAWVKHEIKMEIVLQDPALQLEDIKSTMVDSNNTPPPETPKHKGERASRASRSSSKRAPGHLNEQDAQQLLSTGNMVKVGDQYYAKGTPEAKAELARREAAKSKPTEWTAPSVNGEREQNEGSNFPVPPYHVEEDSDGWTIVDAEGDGLETFDTLAEAQAKIDELNDEGHKPEAAPKSVREPYHNTDPRGKFLVRCQTIEGYPTGRWVLLPQGTAVNKHVDFRYKTEADALAAVSYMNAELDRKYPVSQEVKDEMVWTAIEKDNTWNVEQRLLSEVPKGCFVFESEKEAKADVALTMRKREEIAIMKTPSSELTKEQQEILRIEVLKSYHQWFDEWLSEWDIHKDFIIKTIDFHYFEKLAKQAKSKKAQSKLAQEDDEFKDAVNSLKGMGTPSSYEEALA